MSKINYFFTNKEDGNLAYHKTAIKNQVIENKIKLAKKYKFNLDDLIYMNQVHGNNVQIVDKTSPRVIKNCDGIITSSKNLTLMVLVADCVPILFKDEKKQVIAAVHAGRNSTFLNIAKITAEKMMNNFSCEAKDIEVIIGPSIQKCCYEVNEDLRKIVKNSFSDKFIFGNNIDLQGINKELLNSVGIDKITISNICTKCSNKPYFSYRINKNCGRFAGLITIN